MGTWILKHAVGPLLLDPAGRLTDVTVDGTLAAHYEYDPNGNRLGVIRPGTGTVSGTYDAQDRVTSYGAITSTHSANGDLLTATGGGETTRYSYDVFGNLTTVTLPNGPTIEYFIDGQNRRIGKKLNGTLAHQAGVVSFIAFFPSSLPAPRYRPLPPLGGPEDMRGGLPLWSARTPRRPAHWQRPRLPRRGSPDPERAPRAARELLGGGLRFRGHGVFDSAGRVM